MEFMYLVFTRMPGESYLYAAFSAGVEPDFSD